jgi:hypothetical protein
VTSSGFSCLAQFARILHRDLGAMELAIEKPWNNGPVEGQINRLKVIKRQMYGRAGFELLKARVLPLSVRLLVEPHGGSSHVARLIGGEAAFTDRRHCSLISREEQIAAREGRRNNNERRRNNNDDISTQPLPSDTRVVAANEALFKRSRCVSVMVRG